MTTDVLDTWDRRTSWYELTRTVQHNSEDGKEKGLTAAGCFVLGKPEDQSAPIVFRTAYPAGHVTSAHSHRVNYSEWILDGSREITRKVYRAGDIQVATAGTFYGPLIAGPAGAVALLVFASQAYPRISVEEARRISRESPENRYFHKANWDDLFAATPQGDDGSLSASYVVGRPDDVDAPVVLKAYHPPGVTVKAKQYPCAFANIICEGSLTDGGKDFTAGEIRVASAGCVRGPLVAGPMGVTLFSVFANSR
jgi:hypothetical protein